MQDLPCLRSESRCLLRKSVFGWLQPFRAGSASSSSRDAGGPKHKVLQAVTYTADLSGMALVRGALTEGSTLKTHTKYKNLSKEKYKQSNNVPSHVHGCPRNVT